MSKIRKEIECLTRLQELTYQLDQILQFLLSENLIDSSRVNFIRQSSEPSKELQSALKDLQVRQKLQLLEYEWTLLPIENIRIYIVTDRNSAEFVYNG